MINKFAKTMKQRPVRLLIAAFFAAALFSCGNQGRQEDPKEIAEEQNEEKMEGTDLKKDTDFAVTAADGAMLEVQLGQLAKTNASSPEVKKFAQMMVTEHSKANDELKTIAQQKNISLPATLGEDHQKKYEDLAKKKGLEFDKEYMDFMVKDHEDDLDAFEKQAEDGNDPELKSWAANKVSTLRNHLDMAKSTHEIVKNKKK
jgi:putative membrane protein